jgi:hypothetical protein
MVRRRAPFSRWRCWWSGRCVPGALGRVLALMVLCWRSADVKEVELLVLRHQLACGCQKVDRRLRAGGSPREAMTQMIGGWLYDCSI